MVDTYKERYMSPIETVNFVLNNSIFIALGLVAISAIAAIRILHLQKKVDS